MQKKIFLVLLVLCVAVVAAGRHPRTRQGRPHGGFLNVGLEHLLKPTELGYRVSDDLPLNFTQPVDHFNPQDSRTFAQYYYVNSTYWNQNATGTGAAPVFIMLGGEGPNSPLWNHVGEIMVLAQKYKALVFSVEHRFYGISQPTGDLSMASLQYLSSQQALADFAAFISAMKTQYSLSDKVNPWISFGGSYSGALSAWLRLKYPNLIADAVASSAPVLAKLDFKAYFEVVNASLQTTAHGAQCVANIANVTQLIQNMTQTPAGLSQLAADFKLCNASDLQTANDIMNFMETLTNPWANTVQYNRDNRYWGSGWNITIDDLCATMTTNISTVQDMYKAYMAINDLMLNVAQQTCVTNINYNTMIAQMKNESLAGPFNDGTRQWTYQTCAEFGYFQSSNSANQPFGNMFPLSFYTQQCEDIYGAGFNANATQAFIEWTNAYYGGRSVENTNIVFPNGKIDPWHWLSETSSNTQLSQTFLLIDGGAHCSDLYPPNSATDSSALQSARSTIDSLVGQWVSGSDSSNGGMSAGMIAMIVLCCVLAVTVVVMALAFYVNSKQVSPSNYAVLTHA